MMATNGVVRCLVEPIDGDENLCSISILMASVALYLDDGGLSGAAVLAELGSRALDGRSNG